MHNFIITPPEFDQLQISQNYDAMLILFCIQVKDIYSPEVWLKRENNFSVQSYQDFLLLPNVILRSTSHLFPDVIELEEVYNTEKNLNAISFVVSIKDLGRKSILHQV